MARRRDKDAALFGVIYWTYSPNSPAIVSICPLNLPNPKVFTLQDFSRFFFQ